LPLIGDSISFSDRQNGEKQIIESKNEGLSDAI